MYIIRYILGSLFFSLFLVKISNAYSGQENDYLFRLASREADGSGDEDSFREKPEDVVGPTGGTYDTSGVWAGPAEGKRGSGIQGGAGGGSFKPAKPINPCELPPDSGRCKGDFIRLYYEPMTKECKTFSYSGCAGNSNRFASHSACIEICHPYDPKIPNPLVVAGARVYDENEKEDKDKDDEDEDKDDKDKDDDEKDKDKDKGDDDDDDKKVEMMSRPQKKPKPKVIKLTPSKITIVERFKAGSEDEKRDKALAARAILKKLGFDYNTGWRYASFDGEAE